MRDLFEKCDLSLRGVRRVSIAPSPPWEQVRPQIDTSLADSRKCDLPPYEARSRTMQHISSYEGCTAVYTDGSKTSEGVGCAFVAGSDTRSFSLPARASVFSAELLAIDKAICFIEVCDDASYVILTDSLSSLLALRSFNPTDPLLQDILTRLTSLDVAGKSIQFCWIPSHVGVSGNELADAAARRAACAPCTRRLPLPARDFCPAVNGFMLSQWQHEWEARPSKLRELKPTLKVWQSSSRRNRQEEVILCRLRIGHTYATHGHILRGEEKPLCPRCYVPLTVAHVLLSCPRVRGSRAQHLGRIGPDITLRHILGDESAWVSSGSLFSFIRAIQFPVIYHPR